MKSVQQVGRQTKHRRVKSKLMKRAGMLSRKQYEALDLDSRVAVIQQLVPLGLLAAAELMEQEVTSVAGPWYGRKDPKRRIYRNGMAQGSIKLAGQRVPIAVPRIIDEQGEVSLKSYRLLHDGDELDESMFRQVLYGVSCRNYERAAVAVPGAIGISKSTVSQRFVRASKQQLKAFQERSLSRCDLVAVFVDGKPLADDQMVIAQGVALAGHKHLLGFTQTATENKRAVTALLRSLIDRGLDTSQGLLVIIDGSKGALHRSAQCVWQARGYPTLPLSQTRKHRELLAGQRAVVDAQPPSASLRSPQLRRGAPGAAGHSARARRPQPIGDEESGRRLRRNADAASALVSSPCSDAHSRPPTASSRSTHRLKSAAAKLTIGRTRTTNAAGSPPRWSTSSHGCNASTDTNTS